MSIRSIWRGPEDDVVLLEAVELLRRGGVIACPTETFYALAVDAFQETALRRLMEIKDRAPDKAMLVLVADQQMVAAVAEYIPPLAQTLMSRFWPGPLTLLLPAKADLPAAITAKNGTVGVRQPGHPLARRLCQLYGQPLTGTSANLSGKKPLAKAAEVQQELGKYLDLILENSPCGGDMPSTILNVVENPPRLIRRGAIGLEELEPYCGWKKRKI